MTQKKSLPILLFSLISAGFTLAQPSLTPVDAETAEKAFAIMDKTDDMLAYHGDYSATVSLVIEKPSKPKENLQFKIFSRTDKKLATMVQLFPDADKGKGFLIDEDNVWQYDPIGRKFSHSSMKEALGDSDLKVSDLNQEEDQWRKDYEVTGYTKGNLGKYPVHIITLHAITTRPSYILTTFYIREDLPLVLKMEDFSGSGRLMRTTLNPKYTKVPAGYVATQSIIRDELNKGENTQQILSDLMFDKLPDSIFTKAYLEGLN